MWSISDALVIGEKILQDALEKWTTQTNSKANFKLTQDIGMHIFLHIYVQCDLLYYLSYPSLSDHK